MLVERDVSGGLVKLTGNPAHGYSGGHLCGKTALFKDVQESADRLHTPLLRESGKLVPATWDQALARIAQGLRGVPGDRILGLGYAGNMGQLARKYPTRVLNALGATRHDGGICDGEAACGFELVFGRAVGCDLEQLDGAPGLLIWGCDLVRTVQHSLPRVRALCRSGKPVVVVDVHRSDTVRRVEAWGGKAVIVHPGSDAALLLALAREAFATGAVDRAARAEDCAGLAEFEAQVQDAPTLEDAAGQCGITPETARELHALLAERRVWVKAGIGWTRRFQGANAMRALCSLVAVHGLEQSFHFESGGSFPSFTELIARPDLRPEGVPPRVVPHVAVGRSLDAGDYTVVFVWGHNPAVTLPDSLAVRRGLSRDDCLVVVHDLFLTETAELADVVLPAASFLEQADLYTSYGHRYMQAAQRILESPGEACGNVETFRRIARALELPAEVWSADAEQLFEEVRAQASEVISADDRTRFLAGEPVKLAADPGVDRKTNSGRIELASAEAARRGGPLVPTWNAADPPREEGRFQLHCAPTKHTHNSTYLHSARHLARVGDSRCTLHPDDAVELGVVDGGVVRLSNARSALTLGVRISADVSRGMVRVDGLFRSIDTPEGLGLNTLTVSDPGDLGLGNSYYSTRVDVARSDARSDSTDPR